ncbi:MAG: hypothetical protein IJU84_08610, partial [Clostridia bacterium]|nr:hypothetical protein [Clostridia bacterium]
GQVTVAEGGTHGASFVCANENTVTNSYFLNTAGNCAIGWQKQQNPNIQKSEEWLKNPANFIEAGWDESVWCFVDGYYPMLRHEGFVAPAPLATISITNTEEYLDYNVEQQRTLQINYVIKNLENTAVTFALQSAVAGVSLSETGLVTLSDAVADGATFTVTVTSVEKTDLTASITLTVNRANVEEIIEISTLAQLKALTTTTNPADLAKNYRLKNDIEMEGWFNENIGAAANTAFTGTFDGNGYTLNNIQGGNAAANFGIFKEIGAGGVVKNLRVVTSDRRLYVGAASAAITSVNRGTIENVIVEGEIMCTGVWVAGIAFDNYGTIKNCINLAKIEINEDASTLSTKAGIACNNNEGGTITDCYVDKTVTTIVNALNAADAALDAKCEETSVLKTASTFTGWDSDVWTIVDGEYPALKHN